MTAVRTNGSNGEYVVRLYLPGVPHDEVEIDVVGRIVTMRFELPCGIDDAQVIATCSGGAYELHAPRKHHHFAVNADASGV